MCIHPEQLKLRGAAGILCVSCMLLYNMLSYFMLSYGCFVV